MKASNTKMMNKAATIQWSDQTSKLETLSFSPEFFLEVLMMKLFKFMCCDSKNLLRYNNHQFMNF